MAAWNACGDSQRATLTNRNSALGDRLRCRRVDRYPSWVLKNARVRSQADRNASSCPSGTSNALIKTTGSPFMIVSFLILLLATGGLEPGAELAEHACGHVEVGGAQSCREPVHPGRLLLVDRLVPGAAMLGQVAAMVGAVSR